MVKKITTGQWLALWLQAYADAAKAAITFRIFVQVLLVIILGIVERQRRDKLDRDPTVQILGYAWNLLYCGQGVNSISGKLRCSLKPIG